MFAIAKSPDCLSIFLKPGDHLNKLSSISPYSYGIWASDGSYAPISWAAATGSEVAVDFLLSQTGVNLPNDILYMAAMANKPSHGSIRKFRLRGADPNFTVDGHTPLHRFLSDRLLSSKHQSLHIVKALVGPSCNLSLQNQTARTVLHIALDKHMEDIVAYLLEQNARLSATATLLPDMWRWATHKTWFPKVQEAALAADQPYTRIEGNVSATAKPAIVEFSVAATAGRDNPNPICAVVVSAILDSEFKVSNMFGMYIDAKLSYCNQSLQKKVQDYPKYDSPKLNIELVWKSGQRVSSRLFDYHQEDEVTRMLQQLTEDEDSTGTSLFLEWSDLGGPFSEVCVSYILDIYRGPLPYS